MGKWIVIDNQIDGFKLFNFVLQMGGFFEFEVFCCFMYIGMQFFEYSFKVVVMYGFVDFGSNVGLVCVVLIKIGKDIFDVFLNGLWGDFMFGVIGYLMCMMLFGFFDCMIY